MKNDNFEIYIPTRLLNLCLRLSEIIDGQFQIAMELMKESCNVYLITENMKGSYSYYMELKMIKFKQVSESSFRNQNVGMNGNRRDNGNGDDEMEVEQEDGEQEDMDQDDNEEEELEGEGEGKDDGDGDENENEDEDEDMSTQTACEKIGKAYNEFF